MKLISLGRTGVRVSRLCLGCMNFGGRTNATDATEIIHHALDGGINFIDTANVYGHDPANFHEGRGRSEEIVGSALKEDGRRAQVVLATKAHFAMSDDPNARGSSRRHLIEACEASLKRLQTDYIDLYQLHHPTNDIPIDETLHALDDLIRAGKVRYIGTSSFAAWQIVESLWASKEHGLHRVISEQPAYNLLDRRAERELIPMAQSYGIAILPWSPTAGGFLTGKYRRDNPLPSGSRFDAFWKGEEQRHFTEAAFAVLDAIEALSGAKGCTSYQLALAWCAQQPGVTSPIIGPRTLQQLQDAIQAATIELTAEELEQLDTVAPPGRAIVPYYGYDGMTWVKWGPHAFHW
ncbi:MAG: aldo/keto reductase [Ardenticatenales bacterium]|nr:aldo/keto reductase [Ardenticatenales bacterium]